MQIEKSTVFTFQIFAILSTQIKLTEKNIFFMVQTTEIYNTIKNQFTQKPPKNDLIFCFLQILKAVKYREKTVANHASTETAPFYIFEPPPTQSHLNRYIFRQKGSETRFLNLAIN